MAQPKVRLPLDLKVTQAQAIENAAQAWGETKIGLILKSLQSYGVNFEEPDNQPARPKKGGA